MQFVRNVLNEQRRRMTGSLMAYLEANVYQHLSEAERKELRTKVLAAVGQYHEVCLDMLKASVDDGSVINEEALHLMAGLHSDVNALRRELTRGHQR